VEALTTIGNPRGPLGLGWVLASRPPQLGPGRAQDRTPTEAGSGGQLDEASTRVLVERARKGDGDAFGELFRAFEDDVGRLCLRLLGSREDSEEAGHETFLRARRGLDGYTDGRPFRPWLLAIASHIALDRLRRRRTEQRIFAAEELSPEEIAAPGPSPLQRELDQALRRRLLGAVDALSVRYRAPIVLRYYAELEIAEIAELLGVTRNQVATLLFRARRRLREALGDADGVDA
jgi:RNA polymerase sigma factor (sigma-70 family)